MWVKIPRGANYFGSGIRKLFSPLTLWWLAVRGLGGWRFGRLAVGRLAVCAVGGLRGWRFTRLAVCAVGGLCGKVQLAVCAAGGLRGWRFAQFARLAVGTAACGWRFGRLAVWAVGGLGGWRFGRLAVWAIGGLGGWRFCGLGGWRFAWLAIDCGRLSGLRLAVCVWRFAFDGLRLAVCVWRFAFGGLRLRFAFGGLRLAVSVWWFAFAGLRLAVSVSRLAVCDRYFINILSSIFYRYFIDILWVFYRYGLPRLVVCVWRFATLSISYRYFINILSIFYRYFIESYRYFIDILSIFYRYLIDTLSIPFLTDFMPDGYLCLFASLSISIIWIPLSIYKTFHSWIMRQFLNNLRSSRASADHSSNRRLLRNTNNTIR